MTRVNPHRQTGLGLLWLSLAVLVAVVAYVALVAWSTPLALLGVLACLGIVEAIAVLRDDASTISESSWRVRNVWASMNARQKALAIALALVAYLSGHLAWQSDRTQRDIACEGRGGHTVCVEATP